VLKCACSILLLCSCSSIPDREAYVQWKDGPCPDGGPQVELVRIVDSPTPTLDCIRAAPPAAAGEIVMLTLIGVPVMACVYDHTVYVNMNLGRVSDEMLQHELEHEFGMIHPSLLPIAQSCVKDDK